MQGLGTLPCHQAASRYHTVPSGRPSIPYRAIRPSLGTIPCHQAGPRYHTVPSGRPLVPYRGICAKLNYTTLCHLVDGIYHDWAVWYITALLYTTLCHLTSPRVTPLNATDRHNPHGATPYYVIRLCAIHLPLPISAIGRHFIPCGYIRHD